jgi:hypothetical protein
MGMLAKVKKAVGVRTSTFDTDGLDDLIAAAVAEMARAGISMPASLDAGEGITESVEDDPLLCRAVVLYCKANFGHTVNSELYQAAFDKLEAALCLRGTNE